MRTLLQKNICPKDIMTKDAFLNAMAVTMALGGSSHQHSNQTYF